MKAATRVVSPPALKGPTYPSSLNSRIRRSWKPECGKSRASKSNHHSLASQSLSDKWMEVQGIRNWEGLLDPLDNTLRDEILRYGDFVEAAYRAFFNSNETLRVPRGYTVTRSLHATCGAHLPGWAAAHLPSWASARSALIGYVAVCTDPDEIARLGRRDVVVAYRGTGTCMEWAENLRMGLAGVGEMAKVQRGFLSMYTTQGEGEDGQPSLRDEVRDEVARVVARYGGDVSVTVTGHSLGAALATLTGHDIRKEFGGMVTVVSFAGPRIGNKAFRKELEKNGTRVLRIVNAGDPVTKVPGFVLNDSMRWMEGTEWVYAEIGKELRLSSRSGGVATCHDLKTYLNLLHNCPLRRRVLSPTHQELVC
ncbi:alpha/beta-Hydrolases superfamily protein [Striga asiatica]|uniref:Alpha/beta-Hydrolases superfamily protein n=1 Tax=Striga asiatica TaxID=4170 RepID=A0A5A7PEF9_STRAF|nr:alpha/beta-Hydrolases superfamily protein [Striga asiatica]